MRIDRERVRTVAVLLVTVVPMTVVVGVLVLEEALGVDVGALVEPLARAELPVSERVAAFLVAGAAATAFGAWCLYVGSKGLASAYRIASNDPVPAGEVYLEDGVVEVEGTAEPIAVGDEGRDPVDVTVGSAYSGATCLAHTWEKKRKRRDRDGNDSSDSWSTVASGEEAVPFYVVDDTGRTAVDPDGATLSLEPTLVSRERNARNRLRKYEGRLQPGDSVHVYGQKRHATDGEGFAAGRVYTDDRLADEVSLGDRLDENEFVGDGGGTYKISDTSETRTILRSTARGAAYVVGGLVCLGFVALSVLPNV